MASTADGTVAFAAVPVPPAPPAGTDAEPGWADSDATLAVWGADDDEPVGPEDDATELWSVDDAVGWDPEDEEPDLDPTFAPPPGWRLPD
jgi:hypothetical protein